MRRVKAASRKLSRLAELAIAGAVAGTSIARAQEAATQTITFDDMDATGGGMDYVPIPENYSGFNWYNFDCANAPGLTQQLGPNGFINGMVTSPNVAFSAFDLPAQLYMSSGGTFDLTSAYMTAVWDDGLQVKVDGYLNGTVVDTASFTLNTSGPTLETFDFTNVDTVEISTSGGTPNPAFSHTGKNFAMDNLTVTSSVSSMVWALPGSGNWDVAANWNQMLTPTIVNDVTIGPVNSLTVTGPASYASVNSLTLGGGSGDATLALQPTGDLAVTNGLVIYGGSSLITSGANVTVAALSVDGTLAQSGAGSLTVGANEIVGNSGNGILTQSGGGNSSLAITIGNNAGSTGSYSLSGTGTVSVTSSEYVGYNGTGAFNQTGGTNSIPGSKDLYLGYNNGSTGTYILSATGSLSAGSEIVGYFGAGNFNQSGGANAIGSLLTVGYNGPTSTYTLSGAGAVSATDETVGFYATGIFNQTSGTNTITSELDIGYVAGSTGSYTLSGGSLSLPAGNVFVGGTNGGNGGAGGMGNLTISNTGQLSVAGTMTVYNSGSVNINGGSTSVGSVSITGNGIVNMNASLAINFGSPASDPVSTIVGYLQSGYHGGAWTGAAGIISTSAAASGRTTTLGYLDGNIDTTDRTQVAPNQILVKYTLVGDANLDGIVNFTDFAVVLKYFAQPGTDWAEGNFAYAANSPSIASTNFTDFADVLKNFLQPFPGGGAGETLGGAAQPLTTTVQVVPTTPAVPEPSGLSLLTAGAVGLLRRRKGISSRAVPQTSPAAGH